MITNKTKNIVVSYQEIICKNLLSQARGLMFRQKHNLIMVFPKEQIISLHTFFVFYPIAALILNEKKEVVEIKRNFRPFSLWKSRKKGKYLVETGMTRISAACMEGDVLEFNEWT